MVTDGERRHRFTIEAPTTTRVGQDRKDAWAVVGHRQGSLVPASASEPVVSEQKQPQTAFKIEMLHFPGLSSRHRLKLNDRLFQIVGPPIADDDRFYHTINVVEREFVEGA